MKLDCGISLQQEVGWDRQTIRTTRYVTYSILYMVLFLGSVLKINLRVRLYDY
jgi:hypothetical protein